MRIEIGAPHKRAEPQLAERSVCRECKDKSCQNCIVGMIYDVFDEIEWEIYRKESNAARQKNRLSRYKNKKRRTP